METQVGEKYKPDPYASVNAAWPSEVPIPTGQEAIAGAKCLYRKFMGRSYRGKWKLTSGRRHTWGRSMVFYVNPEYKWRPGWRGIVHSMSHYIAHRIYPNAKSHGFGHAGLEKEMIQYVVDQGWLQGKLKLEQKNKPSVNLVRYQRVVASIKRWENKRNRAVKKLRKLYSQQRYYNSKKLA